MDLYWPPTRIYSIPDAFIGKLNTTERHRASADATIRSYDNSYRGKKSLSPKSRHGLHRVHYDSAELSRLINVELSLAMASLFGRCPTSRRCTPPKKYARSLERGASSRQNGTTGIFLASASTTSRKTCFDVTAFRVTMTTSARLVSIARAIAPAHDDSPQSDRGSAPVNDRILTREDPSECPRRSTL
jgi:hypothetical protein